jgi:hypothetical protein
MSRVTAASLARIERTLTERDRLVIAALDRLRLATTEQLHRLLDLSGPLTLRASQALLRKLQAARVVSRLDRSVGGVRAGSTGHVYALDAAGQRLSAGAGPAGGRRLRRPWTPGLPFVRHQLAVSELYVRLREAEQVRSLVVLDFDAEPICWRYFTGPGGGRVILKPDAFVRIGLGGYQDTYFIEVDQDTQSLPAITRKLAVYRRFYVTGREQERFGAFPEVLFLVPSEDRGTALADLIARQGGDVQRFAAAALASDAPDLFVREAP